MVHFSLIGKILTGHEATRVPFDTKERKEALKVLKEGKRILKERYQAPTAESTTRHSVKITKVDDSSSRVKVALRRVSDAASALRSQARDTRVGGFVGFVGTEISRSRVYEIVERELKKTVNHLKRDVPAALKGFANGISGLAGEIANRVVKEVKALFSPPPPIFGTSLEEVMEITRKKDPEALLPALIEDCLEFLTDERLQEKGIFRVSGSLAKVEDLKKAYNGGGSGRYETILTNIPL